MHVASCRHPENHFATIDFNIGHLTAISELALQRSVSYSRPSAKFWQDFHRDIGLFTHPTFDRHRPRSHDECSQAQSRERGAAPGKKDTMDGSRPAAAGRGERVAENAALFRVPCAVLAFCKHHRLSRRCPAAPGGAWLLSLKLDGLAGDLASRPPGRFTGMNTNPTHHRPVRERTGYGGRKPRGAWLEKERARTHCLGPIHRNADRLVPATPGWEQEDV